ncbi:GNAT family N-acetyltransferase [Taibaiella soli]|uniref:N-acetyltransferase n=1 Tax=Taibaiella soli TaxID=1649169 RepID=A0A2W2C381_9BACT|nr:GNAT family N-acetyltransferase [Taibaiella soli]PZF74563.1 N-acetyltransferase [Taibaiella soli]
MNDAYKDLPLVDNKAHHRFEMHVGNEFAFLIYELDKPRITLVHTEVPESMEGKGVASALIEKVLEHIEKGGLKLIPVCPFVRAYLKRHPDWKRILDSSVVDF